MKTKILIAMFFCANMFINSAQSQTIQVIYETQPKMQIQVGGGLEQSMIEQIKKSTIVQNMLCYNNGESVYNVMKKEDENQSGGIVIRMQTPENITYKNHNTHKEISYQDFFGKGFLIETELKADEWEITDSTKNIQGYDCTKAVSKNGETTVWYCPNLPITDGPVYTGLPGLVLEVKSDKFTTITKAISDDADCQIAAPKKGKKISKDDFDKMLEKRMKAMEQEGNKMGDDSGGGITIRITK
ncbi:MAG: GLPGLI family protein [Prevotellaceae bacterium]|jgi:GLPGLI family protein|nr:GLPGLI family protein [Prevotellaceae bacterium]